ncbi:hypothetical protein AX16_005521 [Volvariella volvacea WC 439]|nr:hypothetical protein AX16_005521 [Volvariella volvacea WC 439]
MMRRKVNGVAYFESYCGARLTFATISSQDLDITAISESDAHGTYLFEARDVKQKVDVGRAVGFARQELLKQLASKGFNAFLTESWNVTHLRRGKQHRVEVQYSGRPARVLGKVPDRPPPFVAMLQTCN